MDKQAKRILFQTYWKNGWIDDGKGRITSQEDYIYAKENGLMFDPLSISHDDCIEKIITLAAAIHKDKPTNAFLASLSTRRLELRSGIASWFIAKQLKPHRFTPVLLNNSKHICSVCKDFSITVYGKEHHYACEYEHNQNEDLNVLNFERIKWGGIRHGQLLYTLFDLEQLQKENVPEPNNDDITIFHDILHVIDSSNPNDYPGNLRERMSDVVGLKSNKSELSVLLEILACIGVLKPRDYNRPTNIRHDWKFVEYWRGDDRYNKEVVQSVFGKYTV